MFFGLAQSSTAAERANLASAARGRVLEDNEFPGLGRSRAQQHPSRVQILEGEVEEEDPSPLSASVEGASLDIRRPENVCFSESAESPTPVVASCAGEESGIQEWAVSVESEGSSLTNSAFSGLSRSLSQRHWLPAAEPDEQVRPEDNLSISSGSSVEVISRQSSVDAQYANFVLDELDDNTGFVLEVS